MLRSRCLRLSLFSRLVNAHPSTPNHLLRLRVKDTNLIRSRLCLTRSNVAHFHAQPILPPPQPAVGYWLLGCSALVFTIVVVGGVTRLTESGLSITEWKPITGVILPTSLDAWSIEYDKYRLTPEFKMLNSTMTLQEFKRIYYMEWSHRMLGRLIGVAFIIPATYFWLKGRLRPRDKLLVGLATAGIGFQGFLGWHMVRSGLEQSLIIDHDIPRVSQYRLAAHLGTALLLYGGLFWRGLAIVFDHHELLLKDGFRNSTRFRGATLVGASLVFLTALSGAFVAGLDAGLIYNEFPFMGDHIIPPRAELFVRNPWWKNMFENPTTAQFDHRVMALSSYVYLMAFYAVAIPARAFILTSLTRRLLTFSFTMANVQVLLGLSTLLYLVPTELAAGHQAGSLLLMSALLATLVSCGRGSQLSRLKVMMA